MLFEEDDILWLHLCKYIFSHEHNSKLKHHVDDTFKVLKCVNNNVYTIDLPQEKYVVSNTFNILDLRSYHGDEQAL
jgi:hypothetical protein